MKNVLHCDVNLVNYNDSIFAKSDYYRTFFDNEKSLVITKKEYELFEKGSDVLNFNKNLLINLRKLLYKFFYYIIFLFATFEITSGDLLLVDLIYFTYVNIFYFSFFKNANQLTTDLFEYQIIIDFLNRSFSITNEYQKVIKKISFVNFSLFNRERLLLKSTNIEITSHSFANSQKCETIKAFFDLFLNNNNDLYLGKVYINLDDYKNYSNLGKVILIGRDEPLDKQIINHLISKISTADQTILKLIEDIFLLLNIDLLEVANNLKRINIQEKRLLIFLVAIFSDNQLFLFENALNVFNDHIKVMLVNLFFSLQKSSISIWYENSIVIEKLIKRKLFNETS